MDTYFLLIPKSSICLFINSFSSPFVILSTDFSILSFFPKYFLDFFSLRYQAAICSFSLQLKQMSCFLIALISIKLKSLTSKSYSLVLWVSFYFILNANSDDLIVCLLKISSAICFALSNSTALRCYSFKVKLLFISPISTSLQARPVFNSFLNISTRIISLYSVKFFQVQKSSVTIDAL